MKVYARRSALPPDATPRGYRGFTLIELLVVIAIIAILAAILFPVFAQAREKARAITCLNNMKQIGTAVMMYLQDYDETYPMSQYRENGTTGTQHVWEDVIYPYVKNGDRYGGVSYGTGGVYNCPSTGVQAGLYGIHAGLCPDGIYTLNGQPVVTVAMAAVDAPADKVLVAEKGTNGPYGFLTFIVDEWAWTNTAGNPPGSVNGKHFDLGEGSYQGDCDYPIGSSQANYPGCGLYPRYRHQKTCNMLFADGHAKAIARGRLDWYKNLYISGVMPAPY